MSIKNFYELLGISREAGHHEIEAAYKDKCKEARRSPGMDTLLRRLQEAYETLTLPEKRAAYDGILFKLPVIETHQPNTRGLDRGFYTILLSQFLSAVADNALFIAAVALLKEQDAPEWHASALLLSFSVFYVILAPFAGSFADSMHKGRAMMVCNAIKLVGCLAMLAGVPPIISYAIVGFGAAAYSPAKYGIITEYLPHDKLVTANGWLESATVGAIILGTVLGGQLTDDDSSILLMQRINDWMSPAHFGIAAVIVLYLAAAWTNLYIPKLTVRLKHLRLDPAFLLREFFWCVRRLWRDAAGQLSMAVTTLFWGTGATMRLVVLNWAFIWLGLTLKQATLLVAAIAVGTAVGALVAGKIIPLQRAFRVLPTGVLMGVLVLCMLFVHHTPTAAALMLLVGASAGFFVVPLNAMLQHRGHMLMGAGHSIAVQNFNENLGILLMVAVHALLVRYFSSPVPLSASDLLHDQFDVGGMPPMIAIITGFGLLVACTMLIIIWRTRRWASDGTLHEGIISEGVIGDSGA